MSLITKFALVFACVGLIAGCTGNESVTEQGMDSNETAETAESTGSSETTANERQAEGATADQQSNSENDVEVTRQIRQKIMEDESLSTNAHNVKIITENGSVTLKGLVDSQAEKSKVESHARAAAGATPIENQIEITQ